MNIPKELKSYYIKPSKFTLDLLKHNIDKIGFNKYFEGQINCFLDCTKVWKTGQRPVMTTYVTYNYEISNTLVMIEEYAENKDYYIEQLINRHNNNLKFEANNPYDYKPSKVKRSNPVGKIMNNLLWMELTLNKRKKPQLNVNLNKQL